ncbi:hypothetical protein CDAR_469141 [Caerostris darwini]|uniref:Mos1 transposase HTH domain-containing protein n=1 Tax=Caerostris darwini TaxID=1538125 RepID=A0AAV4PZG8_9ARAC|nr:hypothetical protein CDAR_469141 [Caerostris darwini]
MRMITPEKTIPPYILRIQSEMRLILAEEKWKPRPHSKLSPPRPLEVSNMKFYLNQELELTRQHFRVKIYYDFRRGLSQQQCIDQFVSTFGDGAPSKPTAYQWFSQYSSGHRLLMELKKI